MAKKPAAIKNIETDSPAVTEPQAEISKPQPEAFVERGSGEASAPLKRRLSFSVSDDGKHIDWKSLRDKSKSELLTVLRNDPEVMRQLGKGDGEPEFKFTAADAKDGLQLLNSMNSLATRFIFARFKDFPIDDDIAETAFSIPAEDEKVLSERGARLLNRYTSEWIRRNADLVLFCSMYFKVVTMQAKNALVAQYVRNEQARSHQPKPNGKPATTVQTV